MSDFWISSGHHLLDREQGGGLLVTDEFLKLYLARPEMIPPAEACAVERTLHAALLADPRMAVSASDIAAIADADARENWQVLLEFRDYLLRHKTLEGAYVELIRNGVGKNSAFVRQSAGARYSSQCAGWYRGRPGLARRGNVLPYAARHAARWFIDCGGRRNDRRHQYVSGHAARFDAWHSRGGRD